METLAVTEHPPFPPRDPRPDLLPWVPLVPPTPEAPAQPVAPAPAEPPKPTPAETRALAAADKHRAKARSLMRTSRLWATVVIFISTVITAYGEGNAHAALIRHHTPDPWGWFPYPAFEAALIVEIQIGGVLAENDERVVFWGSALRVVTALSAITLCITAAVQDGDGIGALVHALGPFVQFFMAEFLAHSRRRFKAAAEKHQARAEGRESAVRTADERRTDDAAKRTKKASSVSRPRPDGRTKPADGPSTAAAAPAAPVDDDDLLVRAHAAADELERTDQRLNRDNLVRAIRAGGGTIQNKDAGRILAQLRAERGGPDLRPVREKGA